MTARRTRSCHSGERAQEADRSLRGTPCGRLQYPGLRLARHGALRPGVKRVDAFDIMYDLETLTRQRFLKLEAVARGTLGAGKSADGLQAVEWWKTGQVQKIIDYCLQDVKVTRDIFQYGRQNGFVKIQRSEENISQVPVQWN